ncbi:CRISPR-associated protein Cas2 [Desulfonauticus submarinus]|uniref:CRISPR-associated endoribonuclease Cas2 n=1 Tax=Desulfonauticus submarinus TaxID=206665 RepID=A0A1H0FDT7_9BACT|nr:CRISPR-associated endonuclease Cas2 [Desulfonauticus submarinus]SDN92815.1 CRISPR-associated protein Cas2 [Desulfonauticus submarinus]
MLYVVAYDVCSPRRLSRIHKFLKDFGVPVQYSVFECDLDLEQINKMIAGIKDILDLEEDSLIVYPVCRECRPKISIAGQGYIWIDKEFWVY